LQPLELAGPEERKLMIEMKEKTLKFFREMEQNILSKIERAREIDEQNRQLDAEAGDKDEEEDGFYYLDDLHDAKEGEISNRVMPFTASGASAFTASRSMNALDSITKLRMTELHRAASGSGDATQVLSARESLGSVDYGSFDPKMAGRTRKNSSSGLGLGPPRRIRTISTMDGELSILLFEELFLPRADGAFFSGPTGFLPLRRVTVLTFCSMFVRFLRRDPADDASQRRGHGERCRGRWRRDRQARLVLQQ
jgi:hypothetical protein